MKKRIQNDNDKIVERVYQVEDYLDILKDVMDDITTQTHLMNDKELQYDRKMMKKQPKNNNPVNGKKKWVQPIWMPEEPSKDDKVSPSRHSNTKPFVEKNIKQKW